MVRFVSRKSHLADRLASNCRLADNGCIVWDGPFSPRGYGHIGVRVGGKLKTYRTHRLAYELRHGAIPVGLVVRHKCDNPPCINMDHLELGTDADNTADRQVRGRTAIRERNGAAVLTSDQVDEIRSLYGSGSFTQKSLGQRFGVCQAHISKIIRNVQWK